MKYLTWKVYFPENSSEGLTPEGIIRSRGHYADGLFQITDFVILGAVSDNADISNLNEFEIKEISKEEALNIALSKNETAELNNNGELVFAPFVKV